jgi:hypothetical protein
VPLPDPTPLITPGTTTPVADVLRWAMLDGLITLGSVVASVASVIGIYRTLVVTTRGRRQQADLARMAHESYRRQLAVLEYLGIPDPVAGSRSDGDSEPGG